MPNHSGAAWMSYILATGPYAGRLRTSFSNFAKASEASKNGRHRCES